MRRDVVSICSVIFLADIVSGILSPTFSLYAQSLGASLAFIGALSSIAGLTQLLTSMPIGALSDRHGRKIVLTLGMLTFAATTTLYALAPNAVLLIPGRVLAGLFPGRKEIRCSRAYDQPQRPYSQTVKSYPHRAHQLQEIASVHS